MRSLLGRIILDVGFPLSSLSVCPAIPFWPEEFLLKDQLFSLWGSPCVICCFSLAAFNICSLYLIFVSLINMCFGVFCLGFILFGTFWVSLTWLAMSFPILGKFLTIISSSIFSYPLFWSSSSEIPMIRMLGCLPLFQMSLKFSSFTLLFFVYFSLSASFTSTTLSFPSLILSSASVFYCWFPPECF